MISSSVWNNLYILCFFSSVTNLSEGAEYEIEVVALSRDDQQSVSDRITVIFPGFKSIRAASTGIIIGLAFLGITFFVVYILRRYPCRLYQQNTKSKTHLEIS